ncbi:MAG: hypothetical protein NC177_01445 [Ruminococcus flavefaciens]|nr:hypothetical protein [Ruminococcus flavefaciens]
MKEDKKELLSAVAELAKESVILLFHTAELALMIYGLVIFIKSSFK